MLNHSRNLGVSHSSNFAIQSLQQVKDTSDQFPTPSEVSQTMIVVIFASKGGVRFGRIADKAPDRMGIKTKKERYEQVVGIPKGFERLTANSNVGGSIHQEHTEKHDVAGDTPWFFIMDIDSPKGSNLCPLDRVEARTERSAMHRAL